MAAVQVVIRVRLPESTRIGSCADYLVTLTTSTQDG